LKFYEDDDERTIGGVTGVHQAQEQHTSGFWRLFCWLFFLADTREDVGPRMKLSNFPIHTTRLTRVRECELMPSTAVSYRTDVFRQHLFDRDLTGYVMSEDLDLAYRVSRRHQLLAVPTATYNHRKSPVSRNSVRESEMRRVLFTHNQPVSCFPGVGWGDQGADQCHGGGCRSSGGDARASRR
jgi:hypothetical protein